MNMLHDADIISIIERVLKKANYQDHPYDIASDIYNAIEPVLLDIYEDGREDGYDEGFDEGKSTCR